MYWYHTRQLTELLKPLVCYGLPLAAVLIARTITREADHLYCVLLVVTMWIVETVPAAMAATLPLVLQPALGITDTDAVAAVFLSPRFLWLMSLVLLNEVATTTDLAKKAAGRIIELFGYSIRSIVAIISFVVFEVTLFFDGALSMLVVCYLVDAVVKRLQMFRGSDGKQTPAYASCIVEKHGGRVHVPRIPLASTYQPTSEDLANIILCQYWSAVPSSTTTRESPVEAACTDLYPVSTMSKPSSGSEPWVEAAEAAMAIDSEAQFHDHDHVAGLKSDDNSTGFTTRQPFSSLGIASSQRRVSFIMPAPLAPPYTPGAIARCARNDPDLPVSSPDFTEWGRSSHSVGEELLSSIHGKFSQMKVGLIISVAYASVFGAIGAPYGTSVNLVMAQYFAEHLHQNVTTAKWVAVCLPVSAMAVISSTCLVSRYFIEDWSLDEFGMDFPTFLENVVEIKLKNSKVVELFSLLLLAVTILLLGVVINSVAEAINFECSLPNQLAVAMAMVIALFVIHRSHEKLGLRPVLTLEILIAKIPWELLFVLGGQDCLAEAVLASGALNMAHASLKQLSHWKPFVVQMVLTTSTALLSEVVATGEAHQALLVVATELAVEMKVDPLYYAFPVTIAISTASILPGSAVSIALLMHMTRYSTAKLLFLGTTAKVVTVVCTLVSMNTVAVLVYDFSPKSGHIGKDGPPTSTTVHL
ncbi:uncharacterized protein LOC135370488 [Ornithodoros turicata]|uniref:uncharacterized protein LOC135370488 n=1 Tax=Ornithodoros turicata TaxID=34597 RepID=UPI003139F4FA